MTVYFNSKEKQLASCLVANFLVGALDNTGNERAQQTEAEKITAGINKAKRGRLYALDIKEHTTGGGEIQLSDVTESAEGKLIAKAQV